MQEFLSLYASVENPTLEMILFTYLLAFLLSVLIAATYKNTTPNTLKSGNFIQAMILSTLIGTTISQSTGSLATGVGMLAALSVVQFRSPIRDPRDIIFLFAAISTGIACGSFVFASAAIGAVGFSLIALLLRFTPYNLGSNSIFDLRVRFTANQEIEGFLEQILDKYCLKYSVESIRNNTTNKGETPYQEIDYAILLKADVDYKKLLQDIENQPIVVRKFAKQNSDFEGND
jgi:uncharacterized membrane protein YhiD involved in acid resistance